MDRRSLLIGSTALTAAALATPAVANSSTSQTYTIELEPYQTFADRLREWDAEQILDGKRDDIIISRETFKKMHSMGWFDFVPATARDADGTLCMCLGHRVQVPGSQSTFIGRGQR